MFIHGTLAAGLLLGVSGVPGLFSGHRSSWAERLAVALAVTGALLGFSAAGLSLLSAGGAESLWFRGFVPGNPGLLRIDALACFFLLPVFLVGGLATVYGLGYWSRARHLRTGARLRFWLGLLIGAMAFVVQAGDGVTFLLAWEVMTLAAFFLVSTEDQKPQVRQAGWIYLVGAHFATLMLFGLFALLHRAGDSFELRRLTAAEAGGGLAGSALLLALAGFGLKAGMMPFHFWLPGAHANAPSHVSALLSGVLLKMGIYGILRVLTLLPVLPPFWGVLVLALGTVSAILGVVFALGQHDLKRLLAYHSIENIGIILMGLGLSLIGQATGHPRWTVLGMAGCLLHVWNHALFKSLLFFAAGSVLHGARTREIDRMGGLAKRMPWTAGLFAIGAVAICGLPPLNGFISEFFIYLGLFGTATGASAGWAAVALAAPALAMVGALAVACFVKAYGAVFLGAARSDHGARAHESPRSMLGAMVVLGGCCAIIGLFPGAVLRPLSRAVAIAVGHTGDGVMLGSHFPALALSVLNVGLMAAACGVMLILRRIMRERSTRSALTWDCGYARPAARMQYSASSFAQSLVGLFAWVLRPQVHDAPSPGLFARARQFGTHVPDLVLDGWLMPFWRWMRSALASLRVLQQGSIQQYMLYILLIVFLLLLSLLPMLALVKRLLRP